MGVRRVRALRVLVGTADAAGCDIGAGGFLGLRVLRCPLAPQVDLAPPEDSPLSPLSPMSPVPSSMGDSDADGALAVLAAGGAATASGLMPFLVARGSLVEEDRDFVAQLGLYEVGVFPLVL